MNEKKICVSYVKWLLVMYLFVCIFFFYCSVTEYVFPMKLLQLKDLNLQGYEVILVTSGAVGLGRQRLRYRKLANSRFV